MREEMWFNVYTSEPYWAQIWKSQTDRHPPKTDSLVKFPNSLLALIDGKEYDESNYFSLQSNYNIFTKSVIIMVYYTAESMFYSLFTIKYFSQNKSVIWNDF